MALDTKIQLNAAKLSSDRLTVTAIYEHLFHFRVCTKNNDNKNKQAKLFTYININNDV